MESGIITCGVSPFDLAATPLLAWVANLGTAASFVAARHLSARADQTRGAFLGSILCWAMTIATMSFAYSLLASPIGW